MIGKLENGYIASGSISRDPEMETTKTGKFVTEFSIIAGKKADGTTRFVNCKAWGDLAQAAAELCKGESVMVAGRLDSREYNGKTYNDLVCDWIGQSISVDFSNAAPSSSVPVSPNFTEIGNDDGELPF